MSVFNRRSRRRRLPHGARVVCASGPVPKVVRGTAWLYACPAARHRLHVWGAAPSPQSRHSRKAETFPFPVATVGTHSSLADAPEIVAWVGYEVSRWRRVRHGFGTRLHGRAPAAAFLGGAGGALQATAEAISSERAGENQRDERTAVVAGG